MRSLLFQNLKLTIPTALAFTVLGYGVSLPLSFLVDSDAARWQLHLKHYLISIETQRLRDLGSFQAMVTLGGTVIGVVVAQTTFISYRFAVSDRNPNGE